MKAYTTDKIRNLALAGHSGAGKTTLTEALLYKTGVLTRIPTLTRKRSPEGSLSGSPFFLWNGRM